MKAKTPEGLLRDWLRQTMGGVRDIKWIEPARGSSVGLPDCELSFGNVTIPVELKAWELSKGVIQGKMRPAQIRYHFMAAREKKRTAILFNLPSDMIYLLPGRYVPMADRKVDMGKTVWMGNMNDHHYNLLSRTLLGKSFWEQ